MLALENTFAFTVTFYHRGDADDLADRLYHDAALDDLLLGLPKQRGFFRGDFERRASSWAEALLDGLRDLRHALPAMEIIQIGHDDMVSIEEMARLGGHAPEEVAQTVATAEDFPKPAGQIDDGVDVWHLSDVRAWLTSQGQVWAPLEKELAILAVISQVLVLSEAARNGAQGNEDVVGRALALGWAAHQVDLSEREFELMGEWLRAELNASHQDNPRLAALLAMTKPTIEIDSN